MPPQTQPSSPAPKQARPTSPAPGRQAAPPSSPSQPPDPQAPPRPAGRPDKSQDRAPPRAVPGHGEARQTANPLTDRTARRAAAVDSLRQKREPASEAPPARAEVKAAQAPQDGAVAPGGRATPSEKASEGQAALATLQKQHEEREARVAAAEAKVREAHSATQKRAAEAEAREAKAEAHIKRLEMLRGDPAQFMVEAGIQEEEWKRYWAAGGKQTGEQRRLTENERAVMAMREEVEKVRAEARAEIAGLRREREDAQFQSELAQGDYTLVREMGGIGAVRAKQQALRETLGKDVTLADAAGQLEHEWSHGFKELLKKQGVRATLGLDATTPAEDKPSPEASKAPSPRTLNGSLSSTTNHKGDTLAWNDWKGKREKILRDMARSRGN